MDESPRTPTHRGASLEPPGTPCVFCARPVADAECCPLLPSSHWRCCACEAPAAADHDAA
jgi:hypothetical protein